MMDFSKAAQTKKNRKVNPKKLSKTALVEYISTIEDISNRMCQICKMKKGADFHHPIFGCRGADKDDRILALVCRDCHDECHEHKHEEPNTTAIEIGNNNWSIHNG